eukprot:gnl/TRDRNA2_/TRDRNA2_138910_c0_seq2.p1 gnl/TRDRNA2_/TRDRNA2_138910_c0~~gnl/TRDRNA2_/TRDRNA2_138910_c0_seq2.p1  ORF type:complete len:178 (+),score=21.32 gnl/TRDRNA2_/TRDRNA2_138910_c0_seq2:69-602(+)
MMLVASVLHHGIHSTPRVEKRLLLFDYIAIFPLIAGSLTPICLGVLHDVWGGWVILGVVWGISLAGIWMLLVFQAKLPRWINGVMYMSLGWMGGVVATLIYHRLGLHAVSLMALGGVLFSAGYFVFALERPNPIPGYFGFHEIWHIFVLLAAAVHWAFMYIYVLPYPEGYIHGSSAS